MDTIEELISKDIPFAVIVSMTTFKIKGVHDVSKEFHVIIAEKDSNKTDKTFYLPRGRNDVMERELNESEIDSFKQNLSLYNKVIHNEHGRVYELKTKPFKQFLLS